MAKTTTLKEWAEGHGTAAARVAKRIERFANNTTDPDTSMAAGELLEMMAQAGVSLTGPVKS